MVYSLFQLPLLLRLGLGFHGAPTYWLCKVCCDAWKTVELFKLQGEANQ